MIFDLGGSRWQRQERMMSIAVVVYREKWRERGERELNYYNYNNSTINKYVRCRHRSSSLVAFDQQQPHCYTTDVVAARLSTLMLTLWAHHGGRRRPIPYTFHLSPAMKLHPQTSHRPHNNMGIEIIFYGWFSVGVPICLCCCMRSLPGLYSTIITATK